MIKKNIIKRKRKTFGTLSIFLIILTILITLSVGYSLYSSKLTILGNVSVTKPEVELPTELSKSYATWQVTNSWPGFYELAIVITNMDDDIDGWVISIDLPNAVLEDQIHAWWSSETTYEPMGDYDRITFKCYDYNKKIPQGSELTIPLSLPLNGDIDVKNIIINDMLITDITRLEPLKR